MTVPVAIKLHDGPSKVSAKTPPTVQTVNAATTMHDEKSSTYYIRYKRKSSDEETSPLPMESFVKLSDVPADVSSLEDECFLQ